MLASASSTEFPACSPSAQIIILAISSMVLMLDPRRLLTFREVAHQRSFSRAAERLALTQPAVSQQVAALEQLLGARLIDRRRGRFELTQSGELVLAHADAVAARLRLAETQLDEAIADERRRLRIGAFPSLLATLLPTAIARLLNDAEPLEISAVQGSTDELVAAVRDGRLHLAACFQDAAMPRREHADTTRHDLLEEPMLAALGRRHPLANRRKLRLTDLAHDAWIAATPDGLIYHACRAAGFEPRLAYLTSDPLAIAALVSCDLAVTLTPRLLAPQLTGISTPAIANQPPRRVIYAITPPTDPHPLTAPLLDALRAQAQRVH
jgi:DNA-binding transcriptional LysR family regulator